ncbi:hypothetical protein DICPUDRAFT_37923 [Dictyostelium purpureum]|uniref:Cytochrome P450 family protein n=1 Tax=Dictyostelium purpureum TaxID=5786 RepID=F0ZTK4_DICPU|nr:uncharacterized protein DICPUDRAFT_37923 [Dictyostelium purpureum]EGC32713.1 hypothetical protein DICPUDRAFT_37923 [Dictyostelium purpureum]|eukprot:XP_003290746.1 hypothetical protein DICPUDRAFT_37923 [Dictyostelium purpureum]
MNIIITIPVIFILYCIIDFLYKNLSNRSFKGPIAIPLLGNLLHIKDDPHLVFQRDSKIYNDGKFARYYFCDTMTLAIFDPELLREIFVKNNDSINSRVKTPSTNIIGNRFRGIVTSDEVYWQFHRDILMKSFTGTKVKTLSSSIEKETNHLIDYMKYISKSGQNFSTRNNFMNFNSNIVFDYVFSRRIENIYEGVDIEQNKVLVAIRELFDYLADTVVFNYLNITQPFYYLYFKLFGHTADKLKNILKKYYHEHSETIDLNNPRDVLDSLIIEYRKYDGKEEEQSIIPMTNELILAGVETNSTTMEWFIINMCNHPEYQSKIYNELLAASKSGPITISHRPSTPLFNAAIKETLRLCPPVPFGVPRVAVKDFKVNGLNIPKGTQIIQSLYSIFRDEKYYEEPNKFKPERFLVENNYPFMPYGSGPRDCLGLDISMRELYILLSNILLNFEFSSIDGKPISEQPVFGFSFRPHEYQVKLKYRNN